MRRYSGGCFVQVAPSRPGDRSHRDHIHWVQFAPNRCTGVATETRTEMHAAQLKLVCYDLIRELRWLHRIETARGLHGVVDWLARLPDTSNMRTAVICIDMQNDFCLPDAALFVKESPSCIPKCQQLIEGAREHGVPVIWVIREHEPDGAATECVPSPHHNKAPELPLSSAMGLPSLCLS